MHPTSALINSSQYFAVDVTQIPPEETTTAATPFLAPLVKTVIESFISKDLQKHLTNIIFHSCPSSGIDQPLCLARSLKAAKVCNPLVKSDTPKPHHFFQIFDIFRQRLDYLCVAESIENPHLSTPELLILWLKNGVEVNPLFLTRFTAKELYNILILCNVPLLTKCNSLVMEVLLLLSDKLDDLRSEHWIEMLQIALILKKHDGANGQSNDASLSSFFDKWSKFVSERTESLTLREIKQLDGCLQRINTEESKEIERAITQALYVSGERFLPDALPSPLGIDETVCRPSSHHDAGFETGPSPSFFFASSSPVKHIQEDSSAKRARHNEAGADISRYASSSPTPLETTSSSHRSAFTAIPRSTLESDFNPFSIARRTFSNSEKLISPLISSEGQPNIALDEYLLLPIKATSPAVYGAASSTSFLSATHSEAPSAHSSRVSPSSSFVPEGLAELEDKVPELPNGYQLELPLN